MTHTLHRAGTQANLKDDFTMLCMPAKGVNVEGSGPRMRRFLEIALEHRATNIGDIKTGSAFQTTKETILDNVVDGTIVHAVFPGKPAALGALEQLRKEDLGLSVVVQGLCEEIRDVAAKSELTPHTMNHSLGRWGKRELLPDQGVLEITTMCGHAMVASQLVTHLVDRVARGRTRPENAARELAAQCVCGVFNADRAQALVETLAAALNTATD